MSQKKSGSVAARLAMFENLSKKKENKKLQKVTAKRHSMSDEWENKFKTEKLDLINGPRKQFGEWDATNDQQKDNVSKQRDVGKLNHDWEKDDEQDDGDYAPELPNRPKAKIIQVDNQQHQKTQQQQRPILSAKNAPRDESKEKDETIDYAPDCVEDVDNDDDDNENVDHNEKRPQVESIEELNDEELNDEESNNEQPIDYAPDLSEDIEENNNENMDYAPDIVEDVDK